MAQNNTVRVFSPGGAYLRRISIKEAGRMIFVRRAWVRTHTRQQLTSIIDLQAKVGLNIPGAALKTVYRERLIDTLSTLTPMRAIGDRGNHRFEPWDKRLTGEELRQGRILSKETVRLREAAAAAAREQGRFKRTQGVADYAAY